MKLRNEPYQCILHKTKIIELRLYDEKRQQIQLGDVIEFSNQDDTSDSVLSKTVIGLLHYNTFADIIGDFDVRVFGDWTRDESQNILYTFYTREDEKRFGVVGIRIA